MSTDIGAVADIFDAALALPPKERSAHIEQACNGDERLAQRVQALLDAHDRADQVLLKPPPTSGSSLGHALDGEHPHDVAGTRIGHYTLSHRIAVGGMGVVYEAEQDNPRRSVALKIMKAGIATKSVLRRFEFETQVLGRLQHPNIAHIHDAGVHETEFGPVPYFAMELIDNAKTIIEYADEKSLNSAARLQLFVRVCRAVHHGHQKGVIHRDLKPSNVLVDASGEPKIIDFGVARATDSDASLTTGHTDSGKVIGTVQYMSPEQAGGRTDELDTRSDVYSLGVLLFELLSGSLPYALEEHAILDAVRIIQHDEPAALGSTSAALRGDIETIVAKAIEKEPARRYQSADELAADIRRYLNHEPIMARPATVRYQLAKFARRNKALVGGAAATVAALIIGVISTTTFALRAAEQRSLAEQREQEAIRAKQRADTNFATARDAVENMLTRVGAIKLKNVPQVDSVRRELLEDALELHQRFLNEDPGNPQVRFDASRAYRLVAGIQRAHGDLQDAKTALFQSLALVQYLNDEFPSNEKYRRDLADCYRKLGGVSSDLARHEDSERFYRRSLGIWDALLAEEPQSPLYRKGRAGALNNIGILIFDTGRTKESEAPLRECVAMIEALASEDPDNFTSSDWDNLATSHSNLGRTFYRMDRLAEAETEFQRAVRITEKLVADHPDVARFRGSLAFYCSNLGGALDDNRKTDEAEEVLLRGIDLLQQLIADFPREHDHRKVIIGSLANLALLHKYDQLAEEALKHWLRAIEIGEELIEQVPDMPEYTSLLADIYRRAGEFQTRAALSEQAERSHERSANLYERLAVDMPKLPEYRFETFKSQAKLAETLRVAGKNKKAVEWYRKALATHEPLPDRFTVQADQRHTLARTIHYAGETLLRENQSEEAVPYLQRALAIREALVDEIPTNEHYWVDLASTAMYLGTALHYSGRCSEARAAYADALRLRDQLIVDFPENPQNRHYAAPLCNSFAWALLTCSDPSIEDAQWAVELSVRATEIIPTYALNWRTRGVGHYRAGEWHEAVAALDQFRRLSDGGDPIHWFILAMAHARLGDQAEARRWYDQAATFMMEKEIEEKTLLLMRDEAAELLGIDTTPAFVEPGP